MQVLQARWSADSLVFSPDLRLGFFEDRNENPHTRTRQRPILNEIDDVWNYD